MSVSKSKICVVGAGYVGLSIALSLSRHNSVDLLDIDQKKIRNINNKISPLEEDDIKEYLSSKELLLKGTTSPEEAYKEKEIIILAVPTNYIEEVNYFDVSILEKTLEKINEINQEALIVIKSTIPIGFTEKARSLYPNLEIVFCPEFLREGKCMFDVLNPSRIIVDSKSKKTKEFLDILIQSSEKKDIPILHVGTKEAESIKLFANSYLALRVAFFNELDSFSLSNNLETRDIIEGICTDERIGMTYNNPSFGYGGYCLPKDTKQLHSNFLESNTPNDLIESIINSNQTRKEFLVDHILNKNPKKVGIYKLAMKEGSSNHRESAIASIIEGLKDKVEIIIYEPSLKGEVNGVRVESDFNKFKLSTDLIITNRYESCLDSVKNKVYTRDIFGNN